MTLKKILISTRAYRTIPSLMVMLVSCAFTQSINIIILFLALSCVFLYSAIGIHNALRDKDYELPSYSKHFIFFFILLAFLFTPFHVIILFSVISWLILGLIYNTVARHVLYGDATILAITHYALPSFSASLLTGASISSAATLSGFMFVTFGFIMESRNLKDTKEDAERGYKTLTTVFKEGKLISVTLIASSVICMFLSYFLFSLSLLFLFAFLTVIFSYLKVIFHITRKENSDAVKFLRVLMMLFLISFILGKSTHFLVILFSISLFLAYLILLSIDKMILARTQEEKALL